MGEVYLAEDTKLDRRVAIKVLPPESTADEQAKKRLVREARAVDKLDHPNQAKVMDFGLAIVVSEQSRTDTKAETKVC